MKKYELIIFDLDGTLLDTSRAIFNSVRHAEKIMGFTPADDKEIPAFFGPPPKEIYKKIYGCNEEIALKATQNHREYGKTKGIFESEPYNGIVDLLKTLKLDGYKLGVATLKSEVVAKKILKHHGLFDLLDYIVGMDEEETLTKSQTIKMLEEALHINGKSVMIGDGIYDKIGAEEAGVDFIAVTYGFGFKDLLENNKFNIKYIDKPIELLSWLK